MRKLSNSVLVALLVMSISVPRAVVFANDDEKLTAIVNSLNQEIKDQGQNPKEPCSSNPDRLQDRKQNFESTIEKNCTVGFDWRKFCWSVFKNTSLTLATSAVTAYAASCSAAYFSSSDNQNAAQNIAMATALSGAINNSVNQIMEAVKNCTLDKKEALKRLHDVIIKESYSEVQKLPVQVRKKIKTVDGLIRQYLQWSNEDLAERFLARRLIYLSVPISAKNTAHYEKINPYKDDLKTVKKSDSEIGVEKEKQKGKREKLEGRIKALLESLPDDNRTTLESLIHRIRDNSVSKNPTRVQAYLYGPQGTGKTRFVEQLGQALRLPVCTIKLNAINQEELFGASAENHYTEEPDSKILGRLAECFIKSGYTNPIIFLDEASDFMAMKPKTSDDSNKDDKSQLMGALKKVLDPKNKNLEHKGLGIEFDISRATVIFAGNHEINDELRTRMPQITFDKLTEKEKKVAAARQILAEIENIRDLYEDDISLEIVQEVMKYKDDILRADARNPGARILTEVIPEVFSFVKGRKLATSHSELPDQEVKKFIEIQFAQRERQSPTAPANESTAASAANP